jgi:hypothetical protein
LALEKYCYIFRRTVIVARQREVKYVSMDTLPSPTVLVTVGGATVAWQPTVGPAGLPIVAARVLYKEGTTLTESVERDKTV